MRRFTEHFPITLFKDSHQKGVKDMDFYIAQGISVLTAAVAIVMMQFKNMRLILLGQILANLLTAFTYFLLGGFSGAGICFIAIVQSVVMFFYNKKGKKTHLPVILGFVLLYIACSAYYFGSVIDIFSALAAVALLSALCRQNPRCRGSGMH